MAAKKKMGAGESYPRRVAFEGVGVMVDRRADGRFSIRWREGGAWKKTTRGTESDAMEWAAEKARKLARGTGERWVKAGEAEAMDALKSLAAAQGLDLGRMVSEMMAASERAGSAGRLREAVDYYMVSGPGAVMDCTLAEALRIVRAEYDHSRGATRNTMRVALDHMGRLMPEKRLAEVTREDVERFVYEVGKSIRTARNRLTQAGTFFARCRTLGMWPEARPLPTAAVKRPRLPDKAPEIFTPTQGKRFLARVVKDCPRYLSYLVMAGWVGCRPSECCKIRWESMDLDHGMLHLDPDVVGKTARERWVPLEAEVLAFFTRWQETHAPEATDRVCLTRAREELSKLARSMGMAWPADVLRHSAITYALQISGNDYNRTAERMGNSPKVIETNYRRPIPAGFGRQWFALLEDI